MKYFLFVITFWFTCFTNAQNIPLINLTEKDGLPHAIVYRVLQDKEGYIWFSTDNGLSRYDGSLFNNFYLEDGLGSNFIFGTHQQDNGSMLIAAYENGIVEYRDNQFKRNRSYRNIPYPIDFANTRKGLFILNRTLHVFLNGHPVKNEKGELCKLSCVIESSDGKILGFGNGIFTYSSKRRRFIRTLDLVKKKYFLNSAQQLRNGDFIVAENSGLYRISSDFKKIKLILPGNFSNSRKSVYKDRFDNIWAADINGKLWLFSPSLNHKRVILEDVIVNQLMEDRNGNIWLATYGNGVYCIPNPTIRKIDVRGELIKDLGILSLSNNTHCIPLMQKDYVIDCDSDLTRYLNLQPIDFYLRENGIIYAGNNEYAVACRNALFFVRNRQLLPTQLEIYSKSITKIIRTSKGDYWIGTRSGLLQIDNDLRSTKIVAALGEAIIYDVCETSNGNLALATSNGVYVKNGKQWSNYGKSSGLASLVVNTIGYQKNTKTLWIGTNQGVYTLNNRRITPFKSLTRIRCNDIEIDKKQRVWFATSEGLYARTGKRLSIFGKLFGFQSGIRKLTYNKQTNVLFALFYNQILEIPIHTLFRKQPIQSSTIQIDEISIDNQHINTEKEEIFFSDENRSIHVRVSYPNFNLSTQNRLYYRINKDIFIPISDQHNLHLYNLPYGKNELEILALDANNKIVASKKLTINYPQPFYKSNLFMVLAFLLILAITISNTRRYLHRKHLKRQRYYDTQQQLAELRQKSLQNMLNPHFLNNAINSIQAFVVRNDQRNTLRYLSKLAKLMRLNLELLESSFVTIKKELDNIELYLNFFV